MSRLHVHLGPGIKAPVMSPSSSQFVTFITCPGSSPEVNKKSDKKNASLLYNKLSSHWNAKQQVLNVVSRCFVSSAYSAQLGLLNWPASLHKEGGDEVAD